MDSLRAALSQSEVDDPGLLRAFPLLSATELGLEPAQASARRRRIGKRKGPGDQELQQYRVGDPMFSTGLISAGIVGSPFSLFSMYFSLSLVLEVRSRPPSLSSVCFFLSPSSHCPFPGPLVLEVLSSIPRPMHRFSS